MILNTACTDTSVCLSLLSIYSDRYSLGLLVRHSDVHIEKYTSKFMFFFPLLHLFIYFPPQNLQWARDVLLGSSVPWQQLKHMPAQGLFCERNKTNLFNVSQLTVFSMPACVCFPSSPHHCVTTHCLIHLTGTCRHL